MRLDVQASAADCGERRQAGAVGTDVQATLDTGEHGQIDTPGADGQVSADCGERWQASVIGIDVQVSGYFGDVGQVVGVALGDGQITVMDFALHN